LWRGVKYDSLEKGKPWLNPGLNGAKIRRMEMVLARKGPLGFSPVSSLNPDTGWKSMTLLSKVSSDLSKCFLRGVLRAHRYHATVLV
jgi:hypothetical protein